MGFKEKVEKGLDSTTSKKKKPEIEAVLEWIVRLAAAKDASGVIKLLNTAGTDKTRMADAVRAATQLTRDKSEKTTGELEALLEDPTKNKGKIVELVKEMVTGNKRDKGKIIAGAPPALSESYRELVDWLADGAKDVVKRDLALEKIRTLDKGSLDKLETRLEAARLAGAKIEEEGIRVVMGEIQKQRIKKREVKRDLGDEDAKKINNQALKLKDKLEERGKRGGVKERGEASTDRRHLIEAVKIMAKIKGESGGKSWEEYIEANLTDDERQLLIAGLHVIDRELRNNESEYEELYVFMRQVNEAWGGIKREQAESARRKQITEEYGKSYQASREGDERMMPERMTAKYLREHPEILKQFSEYGEFSDLLMNPETNTAEYLRHSRFGLNVDFSILEEGSEIAETLKAAGLEGIIDMDTLKDKGVPSLRLTGFTPEQRKQAENIILQALLKQVRILVSESVERSSMMYDPRATPYLTLLSIAGVSTDLKQTVGAHMKLHYMEYMWRNGYVDEEVYTNLTKFFSEQGPEYRLHEQLKIRERFVLVGKEGKEVGVGEFNLYDFEKYLTRNVSAADKAHFGMPDNVDRTYATALATKVTPEGMAADRKIFLKTMLREHLGDSEYRRVVRQFDNEADFLDKFMGESGKYNDYIHKSYIYWIGNGRLGEVVGNGNLQSNEAFELAQGVPEYYYKRDPRLMVMFLWVYKPQLVPDVLAPIMRMGITSLASMYGEEIATHFIVKKDTAQGAKGIESTFLRGARAEYVEAWREMWEDSLYDYDEYHEDHSVGHGHEESIYFEKASKKGPKDGKHDSLVSRRTNSDTIGRLERWMERYDADEALGDGFYEAIDWEWAIGRYERDKWVGGKYAHNKELMKFLRDPEKSGKEKLKYFVKHFGDDYFVTDGLKAKRGDQWMKYMGKYQDEFFKAAVEYATNPEVETMAKLVAIVNTIVGVGKVVPFRERMREVLYYMSKSRMLGEKYKIFKVDKEGRIVFNQNKWVGSNKGEFPMPQVEEVTVTPSMNIKKSSALAYRGLEGKVYEPLLERIMLRDMRAANAFPDIEEYNKAVNKWRWGLLWEKDRSTILNLWSLVSGRSISEFIAIGLFEMPPHVFWEWFFENSEKTFETSMKVFVGGGGH